MMKTNIAVITLIFVFLFCLLIVLIATFPSTVFEHAATQFHAFDIKIMIGFISGCYLLPLGLYLTGVRTVKYVLAAFCGVGLLTVSFVILKALYTIGTSGSIVVLIMAAMTFMTNVMWYVVAFNRASDGDDINE